MSARSYAFKVGGLSCVVVSDGQTSVSRERMLKRFPEGTEIAYRQAYAQMGLSFDEAESAMNVLIVHSEDSVVLIDSGEGGNPNGGYLLASMQQASISPESITEVILTHSHGDHVQGLLSATGEVIFPNARYVMSYDEMTFWQQRIDSGMVPQHRAILMMMRERGLRLIALDEPILPHLRAMPLVGHTPGQIGVWIESEGETLAHLADSLHSPMQLVNPEWSAYFDVDKRLSVPTRRAILAQVARERCLVLFYHVPFTGLGRVIHTEKGFQWESLGE